MSAEIYDVLDLSINVKEDARILAVEGLVEATSFEQHSLWSLYTKDGKSLTGSAKNYPTYEWSNHNSGFLITVGKFDNLPVCISVLFVKVQGKNICFWYPTSLVVHHGMINAWFEKHLPDVPKTDAANFSNILN